MLRIHFTAEDLRRTRVARVADPIWEMALSLHALRTGTAAYRAWREQVTRRLPPVVHLLAYLSPPRELRRLPHPRRVPAGSGPASTLFSPPRRG